MVVTSAIHAPPSYPCDIVLPVYNGLVYVRRCIESLLDCTDPNLYRLIIIDDGSDGATNAYLQEVTSRHRQVELHRNHENLGFVKSCNKGIELGRAQFVLLLNSDVIVTPNWLESMISCANQDAKIASVNPITNHAANINLPIPPGLSYLDMHQILQEKAPKEAVDIVTGVGFCMMLRREALGKVGMFDEVFGAGYCEESDLCMRLVTQGWRTVVAPNVFVYHKGSGSFLGEREARYLKNRAIFDERWKAEYLKQFSAFKKRNPLAPIRALFETKSAFAPKPCIRETGRKARHAYRQDNKLQAVKELVKGGMALPHAKRPVLDAGYFAKFNKAKRNEKLRVTYVLPTLGIAGGVLSVVQLVNEMTRSSKVDARLAAVYEQGDVRQWSFLSEPMLFKSPKDLIANLPESDIVIATHWMTSDWVKALFDQGKAKKAVYFLQDYESWFYPKSRRDLREKVKTSYQLIDDKIVKSSWLADMMARDGFATHKIRLGMNLDVFYPRAVTRKRKSENALSIIAMARPSTPQRGFKHMVSALSKVKKARPDTEILLFGDHIEEGSLPFEAQCFGPVSEQNRLAELYSHADLFLDASTFQGFGRPALEAMACGAACVLTNVGGVNEYAVDGVNCLLVPPAKPDIFAKVLLRLMENDALRNRLRQGGFATSQDYCMRREAKETIRFFNELLKDGTQEPPHDKPEPKRAAANV